MSSPNSAAVPRAEGLDAANQQAPQAVSGDVLPPEKPSAESGLSVSRLGAALTAASERRGAAQLLEMASFVSGQQEERERRLEAKIEQLESELRTVRSERDDANVKLATANGAKEERDRAKPVQPLLNLITTTCVAVGLGTIRSGELGWGVALLILAVASFGTSCWLAFKQPKS